ncbi:hypothetical protein B0H13DRAFT_2543776 [Mycena leptocephala]|nr:hypothetical protein B0H13DRAFT_2543776 [Mycena leptocephala]
MSPPVLENPSSNTSENHRQIALDHLLTGLLKFAMNEQGSKSVVKAQGGREGDARTRRAAHTRPSRTACCAMIVDLALSLTASHLASGDQRAALYDCIRVHIVTLRGCKTGSKAIWLFDRMRAYCGLQTYIRSFRFACMTDSNFDTLSFLVHSYSTSR